MLIKEITTSVIAVLIIGGTVYAAITGNGIAVQTLVGIAGAIIGYYFGKYQPTFASFGRGK